MGKLSKNKIMDLLSVRKKRILKLSLIFSIAVAVLVAGLFIYLNYVNRLTYEKYLLAQDLYLQAEQEQNEEKVESLGKAATLFEKVIAQKLWFGNREEIFFYLADCLYRLGNYEKSIKTLEEFQKKYPRSYFSPWARLKMALIYEEMEKYKQAIKIYEIIKEKYAQNPVAPEALLGEARCRELTGDKEGAIKMYRNLISRYPLSYQAKIAEVKLQYFSQKAPAS